MRSRRISDAELDLINTNRNTPLVMAARANDQDVEQRTAPTRLRLALAEAGLNLELAIYVIEQRLQRIGVQPSPLTIAFGLDMLFIGWQGARFAGTPSLERSPHEIAEPITRAQWEAWNAELR